MLIEILFRSIFDSNFSLFKMINISNEHLVVQIDSLGAQLKSCYNKNHQTELIWQADPKYWGKSSPILFPAVGKLWNDTIKIKGDEYKMPKHGFARDLNFKIKNVTSNYALLYIESNAETLKNYPFKFKFSIAYHILGDSLRVSYYVENLNKIKMPFCIGGHPAFNVPAQASQSFDDHYLEFSKNESGRQILLTPNGFLTGKTTPNWLNNNVLKLNDKLFDNDAIILDQLKSNCVSIKNNKAIGVEFKWYNFSSLAFWKPINAPFLCIEPWNGMADIEGFDDEFSKKSGAINLSPNKTFDCHYSMRLLS